MFDTIITDERILERAKSVTESYDDFITAAQNYGSSDQWMYQLENVPLAKDTLNDVKRKLYRAIANVNILEGIRFTLVLLVVSPLANLSLWKDQLKSLALSQETKINI